MADLMDVFVKIGADTSGLESGIDKAKGLAGGLGNAITGGLKVAGAAIAGATAAVGAFAASSVKVGSTFDSSMAQVAATMGVTVDEIGELREFAQQMGATTAFSATQAADALNYMALAGYDAEQSMEMLPNVLNLAAAGGIELAQASDMVTDAQSALGLSAEETTQLVDMMAKASSKSNTSVAQLGDAILTVGGTAKTLAGGTTELNTALGILADNGIKGSEGGTKLRNVILSLSAPTDNAAAALENLGVQTVDAEGNMRPLEDIMTELSTSMDGLGTAEKADIISTIFNKTDIAAVNALLDTSADRWDELSAAIDDSAGAAEAMANTQLDNLNGDITLFKSALEGAQILVSDALTPSLRQFVQFGTEGLTKVSDAFKEGGLSGAMDAFGEVLADGIEMVVDFIPEAIEAGVQLLEAFVGGLIDNAPTILNAVVEIGSMLGSKMLELMQNAADATENFDYVGTVEQIIAYISNAFNGGGVGKFLSLGLEITSNIMNGMIQAIPSLVGGFEQVMSMLGEGLRTGLPNLIKTILEILQGLSQAIVTNAPTLIQSGIDLIKALADGLLNGLPTVVATVPKIIANLLSTIISAAPQLLVGGVELIVNLATGVIQTIPSLIAEFPKMIQQIIQTFNSVDWAGVGKKVVTTIVNGVKALYNALPDVLKAIADAAVEIVTNTDWAGVGRGIIEFIGGGIRTLIREIPDLLKTIGENAFEAFSSIDWLSLGVSLVQGVIDGMASMAGAIIDFLVNLAKDAINSAINWVKEKIGGGGDSGHEGSGGTVPTPTKGVLAPMLNTEGLKLSINQIDSASLGILNLEGVETLNISAIEDINGGAVEETDNETNDDELSVEEPFSMEDMAEAFVQALEKYGLAVEVDHREFGRVVRREVVAT